MTLNSTRSNVPHTCITSIHEAQISLYDQTFSRYRPFWDKCIECPKIDLEPYKVKLPYICITSVRESQISFIFTLQPALFKIQAILRQVHRMTPSDLEPNKAKLPYICITSVRDYQISLCSTLRPALFKIQAILRQVHQMIPNWPWTLQRQITLYLYKNGPWVSNLTLFFSTISRFRVTGHFETRAKNDLKMTLNTTRSKVNHICVTSVPESQFLVRFALRPAVSMI